MTQPTLPPVVQDPGRRFTLKRVGVVVLSTLILIGIFSVTVVETGQVGVAIRSGAAEPRLMTTPGIYLLLPFIERVWLIDTRLQVSEQLIPQSYAVAGGESMMLAGWLAWRVDDPLKFSEIAANGASKVDDRIVSILSEVIGEGVRMRSASSVLRMDVAQSSAAWNDALNKKLLPLGIRSERVGLRQVGLSEAATEAIYGRMRQVETRNAQQMMAALANDERQVAALQTRQREQVLENAYRTAQKNRGNAEAAALAAYTRLYGQNAAVVNAFKATAQESNP